MAMGVSEDKELKKKRKRLRRKEREKAMEDFSGCAGCFGCLSALLGWWIIAIPLWFISVTSLPKDIINVTCPYCKWKNKVKKRKKAFICKLCERKHLIENGKVKK